MTTTAATVSGAATILLVEDNEQVLEVTQDVLEHNGFQVVSTFLPNVALDLVMQESIKVDLLITDVVMPQMNGPDLYHRLREKLPELPVLYMSGYSTNALQLVMQDEKADFLSKPFPAATLLNQIDRILNG